MRRALSTLCLGLAVASASAGCAPYRLQGVVVAGESAGVFPLDGDDPQLNRPGLAGAVLELTLDPSSMHPKPLGAVMTDQRGRFEFAVDHVGAGLLDYQLGILCRAEGYKSQWTQLSLPSGRRRLLIQMVEGRDTGPLRRNTLQETLEMSEHLLK